ncbi:MAG: hypothetical protein IJ333_04865, partial [Clostridia bacterium]|nr:hypothetical protein [Clostridia bacterium]
ILFGSSGFLSCEPVSYLSGELEETVEIFDCRRERIQTVFVENSFASEGGFLAVHSALCRGITVLWSVGDPLPYLAKKMPDYLVGTEEFFWELRQKTDLFKGNWVNLLGGIQIGKDRTPLMSKFAAKAFLETGGKGALLNAPIPLKVQKEELYFVKDFGVRLADMERAISSLPGVAACQCIGEGSGIRLRLQPAGNTDAAALGRKVLAYCREEMNEFHVPEKLEFSANIQ